MPHFFEYMTITAFQQLDFLFFYDDYQCLRFQIRTASDARLNNVNIYRQSLCIMKGVHHRGLK